MVLTGLFEVWDCQNRMGPRDLSQVAWDQAKAEDWVQHPQQVCFDRPPSEPAVVSAADRLGHEGHVGRTCGKGSTLSGQTAKLAALT